MALLHRQAEVVQRGTQPLEQQRATPRIVAEEQHATLTGAVAKDGDLVVGVPRPARDDQLEHRRGPVAEGRGGDVGLGPALEGLAHTDPPFGLQRRHEACQSVQPRGGSHRLRLGAHHARDLEHFGSPWSLPRVLPRVPGP